MPNKANAITRLEFNYMNQVEQNNLAHELFYFNYIYLYCFEAQYNTIFTRESIKGFQPDEALKLC